MKDDKPELERIKKEKLIFSHSIPTEELMELEISKEILDEWQKILVTIAEILETPAAIITRVEIPQLEVFLANIEDDIPFQIGDKLHLTEQYCNSVMIRNERLHVPNALDDEIWKNSPDAKAGLLTYLGYPLTFPSGQIFGTLCVLYLQTNANFIKYDNLLERFKEVINGYLDLEFHKELLLREKQHRTRYERELERNVLLLDNASDSIIIHDFEGNLIYANEKASRMRGYTKKEFMQRIVKDFVPDSTKENFSQRFKRSMEELKERGEQILEVQNVGKDGKIIDLELSKKLISFEGKDYVLSVGRDISDRKRMENALKDEMEVKNLLLNIFSHDFRNLQTAAKGYVEFLLGQETDLSNFTKESLEKVRQSISKTNNLITNLSILMRYDLDYAYDLYPTNLCGIFIELESLLPELYPDKQIQLIVSKEEMKSKVVRADSLLLHLFLNLVLNSVSNDSNEIVKIDIGYEEKEEGFCNISISDYGKGIKPEKRKELFTPYSQFKRKGKGSGLGLFIVKTLVERYNGEVWIKDRVKGDYSQGTCVKIKLPTKVS